MVLCYIRVLIYFECRILLPYTWSYDGEPSRRGRRNAWARSYTCFTTYPHWLLFRIPFSDIHPFSWATIYCQAHDRRNPSEAFHTERQEDRDGDLRGRAMVGRGGLPPAVLVQEPRRLSVPYTSPALVNRRSASWKIYSVVYGPQFIFMLYLFDYYPTAWCPESESEFFGPEFIVKWSIKLSEHPNCDNKV